MALPKSWQNLKILNRKCRFIPKYWDSHGGGESILTFIYISIKALLDAPTNQCQLTFGGYKKNRRKTTTSPEYSLKGIPSIISSLQVIEGFSLFSSLVYAKLSFALFRFI